MRQKLMRKTFLTENEFRQERGRLRECLEKASNLKREGAALSEADITMLEIALNEAVNNAFKHAHTAAKPAVTLSMYVLDSEVLLVRVKDSGQGFRAEDVMSNITAYEKDEERWRWGESGRGIFIMQAVMDKIRYNAKGNSVMLLKTLS